MKAKMITSIATIAVVAGAILFGLQNLARAEEPPTVKQILNRYIEALGGRAAIEKLETRICIGKVITDLSSREQSIFESHYFKAVSKIPQSCYTEEWSDGGIFAEGYDGKTGWAKDRCGVRVDERIGKWRLNWILNPQNALRIEEYYPDLVAEGTTEVQGMTVYSLASPALHRPFYFDIATGLLVGIGPNWEVHDYREVDGVLFPHRLMESRKGGSTTYEFSEVKHNEPVDDSIFVMPEE
jgi:hypothetical protein